MSGVISIEGNIGAGKSTLIQYLQLQTIKEPVDEWLNIGGENLLQKYYQDPKRWGLTFQLNAIHSRINLWNKAMEQEPFQIHFSQRSPSADRHIFGQILKSNGSMSNAQFCIYDQVCKTLMKNCPVKGIIYLKCDPEVCKSRIQKRNREGQSEISVEYLKSVHEKHEQWISRLDQIQILTIDTSQLDINNPQQQNLIKEKIKKFISKFKEVNEGKSSESCSNLL